MNLYIYKILNKNSNIKIYLQLNIYIYILNILIDETNL